MKEKTKYNLWQNSIYMISLGWKNQKSVLWFCLSLVVLTTAERLAELLITPVILSKIEGAVPFSELLFTILSFIFVLMVIRSCTAYISNNTLFGRIEIRRILVSAIHNKFATTSYPNTEDPNVLKHLDKAKMAVNGNNQATEAVWDTLTEVLKNLFGFLTYLFLISSLNPFLILITMITAVTGYLVNKKINEWGYRHREEEAEYSKRIQYISSIAKDINYAKDIRIFGMRPWLTNIYDRAIRLYQAFIAHREKVYIWTNVIDLLLALLRNGIAYAYLITLTLEKGLPASQFLLYFSAISGFTEWVTGLLSRCSALHQQSIDISIVREFLEMPEPFLFEQGDALTPDLSNAYEIKLQHASFRYTGAEKDTLKNINLTIRPGEKIAVVGLNGAGKTTLVKLICGFYDPTEGAVLLNGENIVKFNRFDYYRHFAAVFQQYSTLAVTLAENVSQIDENIDMEKVSACIEKAGLTSKVKSLTNGYDTHIGREVFEDGVDFSGGETQRLMLARALYKDAPVMILDEPTAALDPIAEHDIYQKYNELTAGRTSVYISHRLASTRFCDRILYIEDGMIAEEGTHASLLAAGGKYAELFEVQSRYYKEGGIINEESYIPQNAVFGSNGVK